MYFARQEISVRIIVSTYRMSRWNINRHDTRIFFTENDMFANEKKDGREHED